jgi:Domain of unknown function (DUF6048)
MHLVILKYFLTSALLLLFLSTQAQDKKEKGDSLRRIQKPTGVRIGTDLIAIGKTLFDSPLSGWEVNADVDFGRYYLALDYGLSSRNDSLDNGYYENDGRYLRVGVDINFLLKDPDKNMVFLGFRYGRSSFNEQLTYVTTVDDFGVIQSELSNTNATAGWGELTAGLRVKILKSIWMGYTGRMKFLPSVKGNPELETFDIPGYGKTSKSVYWGFNFQIFYRIPFRKEK